ncbi:MAG: Rpn family recombination-promoting nuclease/putative transposase [Gemmatimonadota bacterium]|nr:Rpn family recombination-promoting nuclease/putative transposase [Gemmatimonadota bacterium]
MSRRHDQSYKLLFSLPLAIKHLIRGFINSDLADELDFDRMESLATERTTSGLVRSQADLIWKIHFKGSSRFLLLPMEFQSRTDRYMAARMQYYVAVAFHGLLAPKTRHNQLAPGGLLPPTLAVTIYNGRDRWKAPADVRDLIEPVGGWLADYQPKLIHKALDLRGLTGQPLPERNVVSWIAGMEADSSAGNVSRVVREVLDTYPGLEHKRLREAFREWVLGAAQSWGIGEEVMKQVESLKEAGMVYAGVEELKEMAQREAHATLVCRQARLKFGTDTAERLSKLLEEVSDPERIARIGDRIILCETGAELLARAREV